MAIEYNNRSNYTLSSGREVYANCGILGLDTRGNIFYGYDGEIYENFTPEERKEVADMMIARWKEWGEMPVPVQSAPTTYDSAQPTASGTGE